MHTEMVIHNPHASAPLTYGLDVVCNVDDETILANVLANSRKTNKWICQQEPHDRVLIICGSGPSIRDETQTINDLIGQGADVWALNNCATYLESIGILPDAQVIMDALPHNVKAIGKAKAHYFASQCNPAMFDAVPDAYLWHSTHGNVMVDQQEGFPDFDGPYFLVGSAVSVGNTALILAYALGYRTIHLFGYDSSNKGVDSHAIHQAWNDGEPMTVNRFRGKDYVSSLTMSLQADAFPSRAWALEREGCTIKVHGYGLLPDKWNAQLTEQEKYEELWSKPEYADVSPGAAVVDTFIEVVRPLECDSIADFGCGSGKASIELAKRGKYLPILVDFAENSRIEAARRFNFVKANLSESIPFKVKHGFCCDVMEHIPPELVDVTLQNIMNACDDCFFQISTVPDSFGGSIGHPLHLSVHPLDWWRDKFISLGYAVRWDSADEITALFHISSTGDSK